MLDVGEAPACMEQAVAVAAVVLVVVVVVVAGVAW
jgi:hypothetical protein